VTATPDWRARKREETHRRLYVTAMRLFGERGYDQVSVGDIAAAARVSVPTFYAHFPSKEQIVMPLPDRGEIDAVLATQPVDLPLADRIRGAMLAWLAHYDDGARTELLDRWRIVAANPGLRNRAAEFERATATLVTEALARDPAASVSPMTADVVVSASLSAYTQILLRWAEADGQETIEEVAEAVLAALREL